MRYSIETTGLVFLALLSTGCAESQPAPEKAVQSAAPSVFGGSTTDTQQYYYGMGEGKSITEARNEALADIASRISISVGAQTQQTTAYRQRYDRERLDRELRTDIQTETSVIDFVGVKDLSTEKIAGRWRVGVSVDRVALAEQYRRKTKQQFQQIEDEYALYENEPLFGRLKRAAAIETSIRKLESDMALLTSIQPGANLSDYRERITAIRRSFSTLAAQTRFYVRGDKHSKGLVALVKARLGSAGYGLAQDHGNIEVVIQTGFEKKDYKVTNSKMANMTFVLRKSHFKVLNADGTLAAEHTVSTRAASSDGVASALQQTKPYERMIDEEGIVTFIGGR